MILTLIDKAIDAAKAGLGFLTKRDENEADAEQAVLVIDNELQKLRLEMYRTFMDSYKAELKSGDKYTMRWRPTLGYGFTTTLVLGALGSLVVKWIIYIKMLQACDWIGQCAGPMPTPDMAALGLMASALGVNVVARTMDKRNGAGQ